MILVQKNSQPSILIATARMNKHSYDILIMPALPNSHWLMVMSSIKQCTVHDFMSIQKCEFLIQK